MRHLATINLISKTKETLEIELLADNSIQILAASGQHFEIDRSEVAKLIKALESSQ